MKGNKEELKKTLPLSAAISLHHNWPDRFKIPMFGLYLDVHTRWLYPFSIVFQELFIKTFTQDNIRAVLEETGENTSKKNKRKESLLTMLITSLFFYILHVQYPLYYITGAFVLCFVTGIIYEKDRNIWGDIMVHFAFGFLPRCFGVLQIIGG